MHLGAQLGEVQDGDLCVGGDVLDGHQEARHHAVKPADLLEPAATAWGPPASSPRGA